MYLSLYCKGSKRVTQGFMVRGSWRPNRTAIYWPPLLWPSALCLSRSPGLLNRGPRGPALCWMMAFFTASYHQLVSKTPSGGLEGPFGRVWLSLPHIVSDVSDPQLIRGSNSPLRRAFSTTSYQQLLWTPSVNNCHAVHRSLSSGASVYECTMGILPCPILLAKSTYAISPHNCHWNVSLPSGASLWNGMFAWAEGQYITSGRSGFIQFSKAFVRKLT